MDGDGRKCEVVLKDGGYNTTIVTTEFDPENQNSEELQRSGWQAILNNVKKYVENSK